MYVFSILLCWQIYVSATPPSIVFIVIDDLGFNDISLHGSPQIPTPNMDEIGLDGLTFMRYYAQPVCSPTRATIMSGRHVIHTGIYTPFESGGTKLHLDTSYTLLPRYLERAANYTSHGVGKWHLGFNSMNATPTSRGFLTHHGYWDGAEDYTSHNVSTKNGSSVYDFYNNTLPVPQYLGEWSTTVFAARAVEIIEQHAAAADGTPLFLYTAFQNVHWPLEAPDNYIARFANSTGGVKQRNLVCAMAAFADDGVGNITAALKRVGMWDNTLVVLVSDNGGPTHLDEGTWSSNFPLRGGKNTLWEGGTRVVGLIRGPGVPMGAVSHAPIHASDWLPTLVSMATGGRDFRDFSPPGEPPYQEGDGLDVWSSIASGGAEPHARNWVLLETHPTSHAYNDTVHGHSLIVGDWKYLTMGPDMESHDDEDGWFIPPGQNPSTVKYSIGCSNPAGGPPKNGSAPLNQCAYPASCLFNISADPCEYEDLSAKHPDVVAELKRVLASNFSGTAVPPIKPEGCNPKIVQIQGPGGPGTWLDAFQPCDA